MVWVKSKGANTAGSWRDQSDRELNCGGLASTIRAHDGCNVAFWYPPIQSIQGSFGPEFHRNLVGIYGEHS